jgi:hypothetical protein
MEELPVLISIGTRSPLFAVMAQNNLIEDMLRRINEDMKTRASSASPLATADFYLSQISTVLPHPSWSDRVTSDLVNNSKNVSL